MTAEHIDALPPEWQIIRGFALQWFVGELSEVAIRSWMPPHGVRAIFDEDGNDVTALKVQDALTTLRRQGRQFMPKLGEIEAIIDPLPLPATFTEVWAAIEQGCKYARSAEHAAEIVGERCGVTAGAWVAANWGRIERAEIRGPQSGQVVGGMRKEYETFAAAEGEKIRRGVAPTTAAAMLERPKAPRQLDMAATVRQLQERSS